MDEDDDVKLAEEEFLEELLGDDDLGTGGEGERVEDDEEDDFERFLNSSIALRKDELQVLLLKQQEVSVNDDIHNLVKSSDEISKEFKFIQPKMIVEESLPISDIVNIEEEVSATPIIAVHSEVVERIQEIELLLSEMISSIEYTASLYEAVAIKPEPLRFIEPVDIKLSELTIFDEASVSQDLSVQIENTIEDFKNQFDDKVVVDSDLYYQKMLKQDEATLKKTNSDIDSIVERDKQKRLVRKEKLRAEQERLHRESKSIKIQKTYRMHIQRRKYLAMLQQIAEMKRLEIEKMQQLIEQERLSYEHRMVEFEDMLSRNYRKLCQEMLDLDRKFMILEDITSNDLRLFQQSLNQNRSMMKMEDEKSAVREKYDRDLDLLKKESKKKEASTNNSSRNSHTSQATDLFEVQDFAPKPKTLSGWGGVVVKPPPVMTTKQQSNLNINSTTLESLCDDVDDIELDNNEAIEDDGALESGGSDTEEFQEKRKLQPLYLPKDTCALSNQCEIDIYKPTVRSYSSNKDYIRQNVDSILTQINDKPNTTYHQLPLFSFECADFVEDNIHADISDNTELVNSLLHWQATIGKNSNGDESIKVPKFVLEDFSQLSSLRSAKTINGKADDINHYLSDNGELKLSVEGISDICFLKAYQNLRVLDLSVNNISNIDYFMEASWDLTELYLKDNILSNVSPITKFEGLRVLNLSSNRITDIRSLNKLCNLNQLTASTNMITKIPVLNSKSLQKLELYHNKIDEIPSKVFEGVTSLTHIDLGRNQISSIDGNVFNCCLHLTQLILSQNVLQAVPAPLRLPNLKSLWLSGNKIENLSTWVSTPRNQHPVFLPMLDKLYLQDNVIKQVDKSSLSTFPLLSDLDLSFNDLENTEAISGIQDCNMLKSLNLSDNKVNAERDLMSWLSLVGINLVELSGKPFNQMEKMSIWNDIFKEKLGWCTNDNAQAFFALSHLSANHSSTFQKIIGQSRLNSTHGNMFHQKLVSLLHTMSKEQNLCKLSEKVISSSPSPQNHDLSLKNIQSRHLNILKRINSPNEIPETMIIYTNLQTSCKPGHPNTISRGNKPSWNEDMQIYHQSTIIIQKLFRGFRIRKKLFAILHSNYHEDDDDDLEDIDFNFNELTNAPELDDNWWLQGNQTFVYGDHKRRKTAFHREEKEEEPANAHVPSLDMPQSRNSDTFLSRPNSTSSTISGFSHAQQDGRMDSMPSSRSRVSNKQDEVAEEWNVSDPRLLQTLMKRNKRMKKFAEAKDNREKLRDPSLRYEKFLKSTGPTVASHEATNISNSKTSGSFGGKPKTFRNKNMRAVPINSWMLGNRDGSEGDSQS